MAKPDIVLVDGHAFSWQRLCELGGNSLRQFKPPSLGDVALFELKDDCRPAAERTAAGRYAEPTFFAATPARRESEEFSLIPFRISGELYSLLGEYLAKTFGPRKGLPEPTFTPSQ
jgi:hypothetical protein